tara:strand:+ start:443 stop:820 length:378 start_codon:yes stop_codon:yes gene_type:complete
VLADLDVIKLLQQSQTQLEELKAANQALLAAGEKNNSSSSSLTPTSEKENSLESLPLAVTLALKDLKKTAILDYTKLEPKIFQHFHSMTEDAVLMALMEYKNSDLNAVKNRPAYLFGIMRNHGKR